MLKAWDERAQRDVLSFKFSGAALEELRALGRAGLLHCPVCKQSVRVRVRARTINHFVHLRLADCPTSDEPMEVVQARAVLYDWLVSKFGDTVTAEYRPDGIDLPRWIDCWVEVRNQRFMYWIAGGGIRKPDARAALAEAAKRLDAQLHVVFTSNAMCLKDDIRGQLKLTTTEREFLQPSRYDVLYRPRSSGSLHYLDGETARLYTLRALKPMEGPQWYTGTERADALESVLILPKTGEFVHPDEAEHLLACEEREKRAREREAVASATRERLEREQQAAADAARERREAQRLRSLEEDRLAALRLIAEHEDRERPVVEGAALPMTPLAPFDDALPCIFCGERTRQDDWFWDNGNGTCRCKRCKTQGKFLLEHR